MILHVVLRIVILLIDLFKNEGAVLCYGDVHHQCAEARDVGHEARLLFPEVVQEFFEECAALRLLLLFLKAVLTLAALGLSHLFLRLMDVFQREEHRDGDYEGQATDQVVYKGCACLLLYLNGDNSSEKLS